MLPYIGEQDVCHKHPVFKSHWTVSSGDIITDMVVRNSCPDQLNRGFTGSLVCFLIGRDHVDFDSFTAHFLLLILTVDLRTCQYQGKVVLIKIAHCCIMKEYAMTVLPL